MNRFFRYTAICLAFMGYGISPAFSQAEFEALYRIEVFKTVDGQTSEYIETQIHMGQEGFFEGWSVRAPFFAKKLIGDQWELITIHPMISWGDYFTREALAIRREAHGEFEEEINRLTELTDFTEDLFSIGPGLEKLEQLFSENSFIQIQAISARGGTIQSLLKEVENLNTIRTAANMARIIPFFVEAGSDTDILLISFYSSMEEIAEEHNAKKYSADEIKEIEANIASYSLKSVSSVAEIINY